MYVSSHNVDYKRHILVMIISILCQVLVFDALQLYNRYEIPLYTLFIITLPFSINRLVLLLIAGVYGVLLDLFMAAGGIYTMTSLFVAFARPTLIRLFYVIEDRYDWGAPTSMTMGGVRYLLYLIVVVFLSTLFYNIAEAYTFNYFNVLLTDASVSTLITVPLLYASQVILFVKRRRRN